MGVLSDIKNSVINIGNNLVNDVKKFANKNLLEGIMAALALTANANGIIKSEEKKKIFGFIQRDESLKVYETQEVLKIFEKYIKNFEFDLDIGKAEAFKAIYKLKDNKEAAKVLIQVCIAVGKADGNFDENERKVVNEICEALELSILVK